MPQQATAAPIEQLIPPEALARSGDAEVCRLIELALQKNRSGRDSLYDAVADLFERRGAELGEIERTLMLQILQRLTLEVEMAVRVKLAQRLASRADTPPELIVMLANDRIEVAYPVLVDSPVLRDDDLIAVIRHRTLQHQLAVAIRAELSERVSEALVATGAEDVIVALLNNADAHISSAVMAHLVEQSRRVDRYQVPLVRRADLPVKCARLMSAWSSAAVRAYIAEHFGLQGRLLDADLAAVLKEVDDEAAAAQAEPSPTQRLVDKLQGAGELTPGFVVKALSQGQVSLFEMSFAKLVGLSPELLHQLVYEPGGKGLAIACHALRIDRAVFLSMLRLIRKGRGKGAELSRSEAAQLSAFYDDLRPDVARMLLRNWLDRRDYMAAVKALFGT